MRWTKFRLKTLTSAEDIVIATLAELGIEGAEIEDNLPLGDDELRQMFVDIPLPAKEDDGTAYLNFYLDEDDDAEAYLKAAKEELEKLRQFTDIGECSIERSSTEDKDWVNNWKQYFHKFKVDDILVLPSWEKEEENDHAGMILHIDPGTAFGTGMHETTQLCMTALKKYIKPGMELLDVGTGSGILSVLALKLGAGHVFATDLDPCAVGAVEDNLGSNAVPAEKMDLLIGNIIDDPEVKDQAGYEKYDIVTANILAEVLIPLSGQIAPHMKHGALFISSGILEGKEESVMKACTDAGLEILESRKLNEWVCVIAKRP